MPSVPSSELLSRVPGNPTVFAYFLPQFHPTPENDAHWGAGFTEWTNVRSAKPLFRGHSQPLVPELGHYNLLNDGSFRRVAQLAYDHDVRGFAYWHYWFGAGRLALEKVPRIHLQDRTIPNSLFFAWDNTDWTKRWIGEDSVIFKQTYSEKSALEHFEYLLPFIDDQRYLRIDDRPVIQVVRPDSRGVFRHIEVLENRMVQRRGQGFHWLFPFARRSAVPDRIAYSLAPFPPGDVWALSTPMRLKSRLKKTGLLRGPIRVSGADYVKAFEKSLSMSLSETDKFVPTLLSGWDTTPRYRRNGVVIVGQTASELLRAQLEVLRSTGRDFPLILVKAWNEWAEGNVLEPVRYNGRTDFPASILRDFWKR